MSNSISRYLYTYLRERFHSQRAGLFCLLMRPRDGASILDVGGGGGDLVARIRDMGVKGRFVVAEIGEYYASSVRARGFEFVQLKEGQPLPFRDQSVDIVLSNSVIEHVTLPKATCMAEMTNSEWVRQSRTSQQWFADEIRRVGQKYFVQTPHKSFPIEAHTWLPLVNWLGHSQTVSLVRVTDKYWVKYCGYSDWNLLGASDMKRLFPDAVIHVERFLGLPKSIIAYRC